jgi:hypothetical protein
VPTAHGRLRWRPCHAESVLLSSEPRPSCCNRRSSPIRDSSPADAGRFTSDTTMSTRNHAHKRGQRHQWHVGLAAWTLERSRRTSDIWGLYCSVSSCILQDSLYPLLSSLRPACVLIACLRHQRESEVLGLLAKLPELTLMIFVPIRLGATFPIGGFLLSHVRENFCEFMGCGGRGFGWPQCAAHAAIEGSEIARTLPQTLRRHA